MFAQFPTLLCYTEVIINDCYILGNISAQQKERKKTGHAFGSDLLSF